MFKTGCLLLLHLLFFSVDIDEMPLFKGKDGDLRQLREVFHEQLSTRLIMDSRHVSP